MQAVDIVEAIIQDLKTREGFREVWAGLPKNSRLQIVNRWLYLAQQTKAGRYSEKAE